jgi:hypothetical protein
LNFCVNDRQDVQVIAPKRYRAAVRAGLGWPQESKFRVIVAMMRRISADQPGCLLWPPPFALLEIHFGQSRFGSR